METTAGSVIDATAQARASHTAAELLAQLGIEEEEQVAPKGSKAKSS